MEGVRLLSDDEIEKFFNDDNETVENEDDVNDVENKIPDSKVGNMFKANGGEDEGDDGDGEGDGSAEDDSAKKATAGTS